MASTTFKQQCPSCEAMVPIKDRGLVGKKIDCPKCKFRFVVEDPGDAEETPAEEEKATKKGKKKEEEATAKAKGKKKTRDDDRYEEDEEGLGRPKLKAKAKSSGSSKMLLGVGLAVFAVALLGVAGYFIMNGGDDKKPSGATTPTAGGGSVPGGGAINPEMAMQGMEGGDGNPQTGGKKEAAKKPSSTAADATNLLPADSEIVIHFAIQDFFRSNLGPLPHDIASLTKGASRLRAAGLAPDDMERILMAGSQSNNWSFFVLRSNKPIQIEVLKESMKLKPGPAPIRGQDYFIGDIRTLLMSFAAIKPYALAMATMSADQTTLAVRLHDDQTLIVASLDPLKKFLEGGGKEAEKPKEPKPNAEGGDPAAGMTPGGQGGMQQQMMQQRQAMRPQARMRGGRAMPNMGGEGAGGENPNSAPAPSNSYLALSPRLKAMLDQLEAKPVLFSIAVDLEGKAFGGMAGGLSGMKNPLGGTMPSLTLSTVGFAIQADGGLGCIAGVEGKNDQTVQFLEQLALSGMDMLTAQIKEHVSLGVDWDRPQQNVANGFGQPGMENMMGGPGAMGGPGMGGMDTSNAMRQQMMQRQQRGGFRGGMPPGMEGPGMAGTNPAMPINPALEEEEPLKGKLTVTGPNLVDRTLLMSVKIDNDGFNYLYETYVSPGLLRSKGTLEMSMKQPQLHDLASAARQYADQNQRFPRGTFDRPLPVGSVRPWPPQHRVSWLADLLPMLGYSELHSQIDFKQSWRDDKNRKAALNLVPEFLDPSTTPDTWYIQSGSLPMPLAATHYVGIAGIGPDAGDYSEKDPATAKKRGIFGYNRQTSLADLGDGASLTILAVQVPPLTRGPWMAGGGSTVRGVPETKSIQPFVSAQYNGKRGTYAVMADGSVRFIPENISDKVFQALCVVDKSKSPSGVEETTLIPRRQPELTTQPPPGVALPGVSVTPPVAPPLEAKPAEAAKTPAKPPVEEKKKP